MKAKAEIGSLALVFLALLVIRLCISSRCFRREEVGRSFPRHGLWVCCVRTKSALVYRI